MEKIQPVVRHLNEKQDTMIKNQNGESKAAVIDMRRYEQMQESMAMVELIAQGKEALVEGRHRPAKDVFRDLKERAMNRRG